MRYIMNINEYKVDNIYQHYTNLDKKDFDIITKVPKRTIFIKWLLDLYQKKQFLLEDIEKADKYLSIFNKPNVYNKLGGLDKITKLKSIQELYDLVKPYYKVEYLDKSDKTDFIEEKCFKKEFKNYKLYIPTTHEESRHLGRGTEWCTAADSKDSKKTFKKYCAASDLLIFINKSDSNMKYQMHIPSAQFMDTEDKSAEYTFDYKNNMDIIDYVMKTYEDGFSVDDSGDEDDEVSNIDRLFTMLDIGYIYEYYDGDHIMAKYHDYYDNKFISDIYNLADVENGSTDILYFFSKFSDGKKDTKLSEIDDSFLFEVRGSIYIHRPHGTGDIPKYDRYKYITFDANGTLGELLNEFNFE